MICLLNVHIVCKCSEAGRQVGARSARLVGRCR